MKRFSVVAVLFAAVTASAVAQKPAEQKPAAQKPAAEKGAAKKETGEAALRAAAKISEDSARKIALKTVPGSTVKAIEIEEEKGVAIWSVDLTVAGKKGIEEVNIDSKTGKVVAKEHEDAKAEKAEAKAEKAEAKKAEAKKPNTPVRKP